MVIHWVKCLKRGHCGVVMLQHMAEPQKRPGEGERPRETWRRLGELARRRVILTGSGGE